MYFWLGLHSVCPASPVFLQHAFGDTCLYGQTVCGSSSVILKKHFLANNDLATNGSAVRGSPGSATIPAYFLLVKNSRTCIYVLLESSQPGIRAAWLWGGCLLWALQDASDGPVLRGCAGSWGKQERGAGLLPVLLGRGTACWWERAWIPGSALRLLALTLFPSVCSLVIYCLLLPLFISSS